MQSMDEETNGTIILPGIQVVKSDSNKGFLSYGELYSNETNAYNETWEHVLYRIQINCEQKCQEKDCHSITYNAIVWRISPDNEQQIVLTIPSTPTISATSQSALSLVQFLTDFGSALGFWLGISAFGLFDHFKKIFNSVLNAKQMTHNKVQKMEVSEGETTVIHEKSIETFNDQALRCYFSIRVAWIAYSVYEETRT